MHLWVILIGTGPLAPAAGNLLAERVLVGQGIGCSETGLLPNVIPDRQDWQWFEWHPTHSGIKMEPLEGNEELCELVVHRTSGLEKFQAVFELFPNLQEFRTRDLLSKHPQKDLWVYVGRRDDVIVLSNGEKFNPVTMEGILTGHSLVSGALVVGMGQPQCGLLLEVSKAAERSTPETIIRQLWPTIEQANAVSPGHGQIAQNMVRLINGPRSPERRFPRAAKGTVIRFTACNEFSAEIRELFEQINEEETVQEDLPAFSDAFIAHDMSMRSFVRQIMTRYLGEGPLTDTDNIFNAGCDSLITARVMRDMKKSLMGRQGTESMTVRLIYENPTIAQLATALQQLLRHGLIGEVNGTAPRDASRASIQRMKTMVDKFSQAMSTKSLTPGHKNSRSLGVVVTGTTGFLGHYLVEALIRNSNVAKIFCLNRSPHAKDKFLSRFRGNADMVEWVQVGFGEPSFGLGEEQFKKLQSEVDVVIHNAWQVCFSPLLRRFQHRC